MCRTNRIQSLLMNEATRSDLAMKHACAILSGGKVLSLSHNSRRTAFAGEVQTSLHAEVSAILTATSVSSSSSPSPPRTSFCHSAPTRQARKFQQQQQQPNRSSSLSAPSPSPATTSFSRDRSTGYAQRKALGGRRSSSSSGGGANTGRRTRGDKATYGADLYVCRITKSGVLAESRPCFRCASWIYEAGIKRVFFTARDDSTNKVSWICQSVPELIDDMLKGAFFATAMDRNFFLGKENQSKLVVEQEKQVDRRKAGKARWVVSKVPERGGGGHGEGRGRGRSKKGG
ncbi:hypothetical protein BDY24DRAFT_414272 [Mrakia frigida]|uniref:uncharacterized protein n=1 Tax=Mrakia frigida TaxID=29902 RepID=UPI003FCC08FF